MNEIPKWHLEEVSIRKLKPHPKNPRQISKEQYEHLKRSIDKFGSAEKIIINQDFTIIGGHQRFKILKEMGDKTVTCWMPDILLSDESADELCIRLNKNTGTFDYDILANEWELIDLLDFGFSEQELFGDVKDTLDDEEDDAKEEQVKKKKKLQCPACLHEFVPE